MEFIGDICKKPVGFGGRVDRFEDEGFELIDEKGVECVVDAGTVVEFND